MLAWVMTACWVFHFTLIYFWRNINISGIFYFSKSTSRNTQYSSLWHTLQMMLFTKYLIKWKTHSQISWKFWYWFHLKSSVELDIQRLMLYFFSAPLTRFLFHFYTYTASFIACFRPDNMFYACLDCCMASHWMICIFVFSEIHWLPW